MFILKQRTLSINFIKNRIMKGILRFDQDKDTWFVDTKERKTQVEPHSCPGNSPTEILSYDAMDIYFTVETLAFGDSADDVREGDFAIIDWEHPWNNLSNLQDDANYSPYCPVCTGCGESGCCSPLNCDPDNPECHYPKTYTADLKLGYRTFEKWYDLLDENDWFGKKEEFMKIYHEMLDIRFGKDGE